MSNDDTDDQLPAMFHRLDRGPDLDMALDLAAGRLFGEVVPTPSIARFEILEVVGSGGMGIVYAARDPRDGQKVALKLVSREALLTSSGAEAEARFAREALVGSRLHHPALVRVRESGSHEGQPFLVMDFIEGKPIDRWVASARPQLGVLVQILVRAGRGLAAAHASGYVHRDFKPANVLVDGRQCPHIVDFGLARPLSSAQVWAELGSMSFEFSITGAGRASGTVGYMAPELFTGAKAGSRTDIFAFCASARELIEMLDQEPPEPLQVVIQRGLARDPRARWARMAELLEALGQAIPAAHS